MDADYKSFREKFEAMEPDFDNHAFLREQYRMLCEGVRDVRIHDAALVAWYEAGGRY